MAAVSHIVRVLVVEDFETFRRFVCSTLAKNPSLRIIGEVSDGIEAVRKAEELRPDLILLDIGLPALNGMVAARQIRKLSPESKIIFVTQESDHDVVQEAFNLGAWAYALKTHAGTDLLTAVDAVLEGRQFVSAALLGQVVATQALPVSSD
jgi:DNA-binding NarL/FixJ family response regulator